MKEKQINVYRILLIFGVTISVITLIGLSGKKENKQELEKEIKLKENVAEMIQRQ